ncbi:MAG: TonB-dependent receptor [Siphonobacter sp.]
MRNCVFFPKKKVISTLSLLSLLTVLTIPNTYARIEQPPVVKKKDVNVSGTVKDQSGQALTGVTVLNKTTKQGTVTDAQGKFSIQAEVGQTLVFSFIGYQSQEITVGNQLILDIQLKDDAQQLNEVVAVGYQTMRKADLTGAVSSVKASELNVSSPTIGQALVGKVAGVQVSQVSGSPYASTKIRVRGIGSINASSDPLYVIDGYPVASNDLFLNNNDIESIDILKDAASAAIYGSRASGGVVLITTKRGKEGRGVWEYEYQTGINQVNKKIDLLNGDEFNQLVIDARNGTYKDLIVNAGGTWTDDMYSDDNATRISESGGSASAVSIPTDIYDFNTQTAIKANYNTNWQDLIYRNAVQQRHSLSFSGGGKNSRYMVSGAYMDQDGVVINTGQKRYNFRANVNADVNSRLKLGSSIFLTYTDNKELSEGRWDHNPIMAALIYPSSYRAYDDEGNVVKNEVAALANTYGFQSIENPIALAQEIDIQRRGFKGTYNANLTYEILNGLNFKINLGVQTYNEKYQYYWPTSLSSGVNPPYSDAAKAAANATATTTAMLDALAEYTLTYSKQFGKHKIDALAGYTAQKTTSDILSVNASGFSDDRIHEVTAKGADASYFTMNSSTAKSAYTLLSYLGRVAYNYKDRYFATASLRTDGSSRFGAQNRWGTFPSVSFGWNISDEPFYQNALGQWSTLKLRSSWGISGNNNIGNYNSLQTMSTSSAAIFGDGVSTAAYANSLKDQKLGWESTQQYNFGADIGLLNGRVSLSANYYLSYSYNLLFNQTISAISGATSILTNLKDSKIRNKGIDLQLDTRLISTHDFTLNLSGNLSINRNKVLDMGGASTIVTAGAERSYKTHITQQGSPVGMFYGFKVAGMVTTEEQKATVAQSASSSNSIKLGDLYFQDTNGDGVVNDDDKTIIGTPYAKFTYGFALSSTYKNVDFNAAFNGSYGNQVLDGQDYYLYNMEGSGNQYHKVTQRWRSESEPGNGQVYRASRSATQSNSTRLSTFYIQDGSFFRCTNITLGYNFPAMDKLTNKVISKLRLYAGVNNPFTITKYLGYNPEVDYNDGANLTPGVDYGKYPLVRAYNIGAKITF